MPREIGKAHFEFVGPASHFKLAGTPERSAATERPSGRDGNLQPAAPKQVHPGIGPEIGVLRRKLDGPIFLGLRLTRDAKKSSGTLNVRLELHSLSFPTDLALKVTDGSSAQTEVMNDEAGLKLRILKRPVATQIEVQTALENIRPWRAGSLRQISGQGSDLGEGEIGTVKLGGKLAPRWIDRSSPRYFARPFTQLDSLKRPQRACHANIGREGVKRLLVDDTPFNLQGTGAAQIGPRALELDPARHLTRYGSVDV